MSKATDWRYERDAEKRHQALSCISHQQAFEWIKTGAWNLGDFRYWCDAQKLEAQRDLND